MQASNNLPTDFQGQYISLFITYTKEQQNFWDNMHCNVCAKRLVFHSTTDIQLQKMDQNEHTTAN